MHTKSTCWETELPGALFAYRNTLHANVGCTPFQALYGRVARLPRQKAVPDSQNTQLDRVQTMYHTWRAARLLIEQSRDANERRVAKRPDAPPLKVGDSVLVRKPGLTSVFAPRWSAQWTVIKAKHPTYWLRNLNSGQEKVLHRDKLMFIHPDLTWDGVRNDEEKLPDEITQLSDTDDNVKLSNPISDRDPPSRVNPITETLQDRNFIRHAQRPSDQVNQVSSQNFNTNQTFGLPFSSENVQSQKLHHHPPTSVSSPLAVEPMAGVTHDESNTSPPRHRPSDSDHQPMWSENELFPPPSPPRNDHVHYNGRRGELAPHPPLRHSPAPGREVVIHSPHPSPRRHLRQHTSTLNPRNRNSHSGNESLKLTFSRKRVGPVLRGPAKWRVIPHKRPRRDANTFWRQRRLQQY